MSPNPQSPVALVAAAERLVRGRAVRALGAAGVALIPLVLVLAWAGAARWGRPSPWPLVLELLAIAGGVALFAAWRTRVRPRLDERAAGPARCADTHASEMELTPHARRPMESGTAIRLGNSGPQGQEMVLVVDFATRTASLLFIHPGNGSVSVHEVVDYGKRGS